jgi:hypothetical protein
MTSNETSTCPFSPPPTVISSAQAKVMEQHANQMTAVYFTAAIAALCALIIGAHYISDIRMKFNDRVPKRLIVVRLVEMSPTLYDLLTQRQAHSKYTTFQSSFSEQRWLFIGVLFLSGHQCGTLAAK